jgi:hypothetical protein
VLRGGFLGGRGGPANQSRNTQLRLTDVQSLGAARRRLQTTPRAWKTCVSIGSDRPSVYRGITQLERDGLVDSWAGTPKAGQARRVYGQAEQGQRAAAGAEGGSQVVLSPVDEAWRLQTR